MREKWTELPRRLWALAGRYQYVLLVLAAVGQSFPARGLPCLGGGGWLRCASVGLGVARRWCCCVPWCP